jgi:hypothetical protein
MSTTNTRRARARTTTLVAAGVLAVGVTVGAVLVLGPDETDAGEPAAAASPTATAAATPTAAPVPAEPPVPGPVVPTGVGETVPVDLVEAARAAGVSVYVSPNGDGAGVVVDGTAPEVAVADAHAIDGTPTDVEAVFAQGEQLTDVAVAFDEAGLRVIVIIPAGQVDAASMRVTGYTTMPNKLVTDFQRVTNGSKAAAIAAAEAYAAAHPGTLVVDTTT